MLFLMMIPLAALWYVQAFGVPHPLLRWMERTLRRMDYSLHIGGIRILWPGHITARDVEYFSTGLESGAPLVSAKRIETDLQWRKWIHGGPLIEYFSMTGGVVRVATYEGPFLNMSEKNLFLHGIEGGLIYRADGLEFTFLKGLICGLPFDAVGFFALPDDLDPKKSIYEQWMGHFAGDLSGPTPEWIQEITAELNRCAFTGGGRVDAVFRLDPVRLNGNSVSLHASGHDALLRGVALTNWMLHGELTNGLACISNTLLHTQSGGCALTAKLDFGKDIMWASLGSTMTMPENLALLPEAWQKDLANFGFAFEGLSDIGIQVGPAGMDEFTQKMTGRIHTDTVLFRNIPLRNVRLAFEWDRDILWLSACDAEVDGQAYGQGTLHSDGMLYLDNRSFVNNFDLSFNPGILLPLVPESVAEFIQRFAFSEQMPQVDGSLSGTWPDGKSIRFKGACRIQDFRWSGAPLTSFDADILVTNDYVRLSSIHTVRDEGEMTGEITLPLDQDAASFDVTSQMNPKIMAEMIHPAVKAILDPFDFHGPTDVRARGSMDYASRTQMNFRVDVRATNISIYTLAFDACRFAVTGTGDEYRVDGFEGSLCGGQLGGNLVFFPITTNNDYRFNLDTLFTNISLNAMMKQLAGTNEITGEAKQGNASGYLLLSGLTESNWVESVMAKGHVKIDEGCLLSIRLFGPLSQWLSRMVPNLGCLTQTEFDSDFVIKDGFLQLDNARMYGNIISIAISGKYGLADKSLDFRVQVKLLRKSLFAKLVNLITYPLTKLLLEFRLSGTLDNPAWRPVNLPKELYFNFR